MEEKDYLQDNKDKWLAYDKCSNETLRKAQAIVTNTFIEKFNDTFICETDKHGIPINGFTPREGIKRGNIKKDWMKNYIWNLVYDLLQTGCFTGIEEINGKWDNIIDVSKYFVRTDKFYGIFLFDYKMEQMFPGDDNLRFRHYRRFTRLRIKLNSPNSEWITII